MTSIFYTIVLVQNIESISSMWGVIGAIVVAIGAVMWDAMVCVFMEENF